MNLKTMLPGLLLSVQVLSVSTASAVCVDPKTLVSGYTIPFAVEVGSADAIVLGRVLSERSLHEDAADPEGITAHEVTIEVVTRLKGQAPDLLAIRNENTSARYPMSAGEEHLLFLSREGARWRVDACGNSATMPQARRLIDRIRSATRASS